MRADLRSLSRTAGPEVHPVHRRQSRARGLLLAASCLLLALSSGCSGCSKPARVQADGGTVGDGGARTELSAATLLPVIRPQAIEGTVPDRLVIEFARPILEHDRRGQPAHKDTVLRIDPEVPGRLTHHGLSTLVFTPEKGFAAATGYTVTLAALHTPQGVIKAPAEQPWQLRFTTPPFKLLDTSLLDVDLSAQDKKKPHVEVRLTFSGKVEIAELKSFASWQVDGAAVPAKEVSYETTELGHVLAARVTSPQLHVGSQVTFALRAGLPMAGFPKIRADRAQSRTTIEDLDSLPTLSIKSVTRSEGTSGFFLDVVCDDDAVKDKRYFYDEVQGERIGGDGDEAEEHRSSYSGRISRRCQLEEASAREKLRLLPAVKFTVAPSAGGFRVLGDFKRGPYTLRIASGARSVDGGVIKAPYERAFSVPARSPRLGFVSTGRYLPRKAWRNLPITHVNSDEVELTVRQVPPENLVFWMSEEGNDRASERTSNIILQKKLPLKGEPDAQSTTWLDVGSLVPATTQGMLQLSLHGAGTAKAEARLLLTNINLVAKREADRKDRPGDIVVFALDMETNTPLAGVEVKLVRKSGQVIARCTTGGAVGCRITPPAQPVDPGPGFALVAQRGDDLTYLRFSDLKTEMPGGVSYGEPFSSEKPYHAALYTDRGVYRPGETAHVVAIVRDEKNQAPRAGMPVLAEITDPRGATYKKLQQALNSAGMLALDLPFDAFANTGKYTVKLRAGDKPLGEETLQVEEFVPERMKVKTQAKAEGYLSGEPVPFDVSARYLFGSPAAAHKVELSCELSPSEFTPDENSEFHYGVWRADTPKDLALGKQDGTLDSEGKGTLECPGTQGEGRFYGTATLSAAAAVFEAGSGRTSVGRDDVEVHPERFYLGLKASAERASPGQEVAVSGIVVDWKGKPVSTVSEVKVEYLHIEEDYGWYYDEEEHQGSYKRYTHAVSDGSDKVSASGGRFSLRFRPSQGADGYLVRVTAGKARTDLLIDGEHYYRYFEPSESESDQTPRPQKPTVLKLKAPPQVKLNADNELRFAAPFPGQALVTVETDHVLRSEWVKVAQAGEVVWRFRVEKFAPNVYLSAFLVKDPHHEAKAAFLPDRAFGVVSAPVARDELAHELKLTVPKDVRSQSTLTVQLEVGHHDPQRDGEAFVTVAVVDEGILSLTGFRTPDPLNELLARRALGVDTFETIGWTLLLPPGGPSSQTGGDEDGDGVADKDDKAGGRVQPVKPVSLWSGVVPVPASGKVSIPFVLPPYRGQLRVMAVSVANKRVGQASAEVVVKDPLVAQTTLPRFLVLGDEITIPVSVSNLSGGAQQVAVRLSAEELAVPGLMPTGDTTPPLVLLGEDKKSLRLKDGEAGVVVFRARAQKAVGAAKVRVVAKAGALESREEADVPLVPAAPLQRTVQRIELAAGEIDLLPYLKGWTPTTEKSTFWVTSNPYGDTFDHLKHLLRYPYGCIEQTTSSTWPLLYVANLLSSVDPTLLAGKKIEDMVQYGVRRVLSMQTPEGGFAYWPGSTHPTDWGTAYATHMLLDAQKKGYPVSEARIKDAVEYIESQLANVYEQGRTPDGWYGGTAEPYLQFVLALGGKGRKARIQQLIEKLAATPITKIDTEDREHEYLLKAALYLAGDRRYERDLKSPDVTPIGKERFNYWSFYSDRRRRAMMLTVFQDLFGKDPAGETLANLVAEGLRGHRSSWYTTQELVWGTIGLGKRIGDRSPIVGTPVLTSADKKLAPQSTGKAGDVTWALARASERRSLTLTVPAGQKGKLYLILGSEGVRADPKEVPLGGNGLSIERRVLDTDGDAVELADGSIDLGDLVVVELTVKNELDEAVTNIAVVDRFPAGWEIENPRLGRGKSAITGGGDHGDDDDDDADKREDKSGTKPWELDYLNLRDDRIEAFGRLEAKEKRSIRYLLRAVTAGRFTMPTVSAEAMYDPELWARGASAPVVISGPWADETPPEPAKKKR